MRWGAGVATVPARMAAVLSVLLVTFPFFALVLCGYLAARSGILPQPAIPGLNAFVLFFALPCMLFRFGPSTPSHNCSTRGWPGCMCCVGW